MHLRVLKKKKEKKRHNQLWFVLPGCQLYLCYVASCSGLAWSGAERDRANDTVPGQKYGAESRKLRSGTWVSGRMGIQVELMQGGQMAR